MTRPVRRAELANTIARLWDEFLYDRPLYVDGHIPQSSTWWHVAIFLVPVLIGVLVIGLLGGR